MIIALISPLRFKKGMLAKYVELSLEGHIVLLPVDLADKPDNTVTEDEAAEPLMALHKNKLDMSHKALVMNVGGYMGRGTYEEIGYATIKGIPIDYLEPVNTRSILKGVSTYKGADENEH